MCDQPRPDRDNNSGGEFPMFYSVPYRTAYSTAATKARTYVENSKSGDDHKIWMFFKISSGVRLPTAVVSFMPKRGKNGAWNEK